MPDNSQLFNYEAKLAVIPHEPGCYLMKDRRGKIVYIGKAKDLKTRLRNYFQASGDSRAFVARLPAILGDIEFIITANEKEALILENTLIKQHKPRYNVIFKDDKHYLSLRIDPQHPWPRVEVIRRPSKDGARYFGPYHSARSIRQTLNVLNKFFMLRTCPDSVLNNRSRPCLQYQIKRCPAPCVFEISRDDYMTDVRAAIMFLEGRGDELIEKLYSKMMAASHTQEYELAARYRDQIESIKKVLERQQAVDQIDIDRDVYGFYRQGAHLTIQLLIIRRGRLEGARSFSYSEQEFPDDEVLASFLNLFYNSGNFIPREILLPDEIPMPDLSAYAELLGESAGHKVSLLTPKRGAKRALVETAMTNARHSFEDEHAKHKRHQDLLQKLQDRLFLRNYPRRIECCDISNLQGAQIVGSLVVFEDGDAAKKEYRKYKMNAVQSQDDFASMRELLTRHLQKVANDEKVAPDLLVIDGGKGQLAQAVAVLEDLGLHDIDVVSLAKSRVDKSGFEDAEVTRSPERVFIPGRKNPVILKENSDELYLLQRVRDEAHRFAITFHQNLRRKQNLLSSLDEISGVGPKTKRELLRHFGSLKRIKEASLQELQQVDGIGPSTATIIYQFFHR